MIGPRINAAGRLEDASIAVNLLLAGTPEEAQPLAARLNKLNQKRQEVSARIFAEAEKMIVADPSILKNKVIVLASDTWHAGVTGIAASQLVRAHVQPAVLITIEGDTARGSIRSPAGVDIFPALRECHELFLNYGGHQEAAGFEIKTLDIPVFTKKYIELLNASIAEDVLQPEIQIDLQLRGADISAELVLELEKLAPFGQGNDLPIFSSDSLELIDFRQVGDGTHLKCTFRDGERHFDGIGFGLGKYAKILSEQAGPWEVAFSLEFNEWNGEKRPQLCLVDIKIKGGPL